jgi:hypothetical protein
MFMFHCRTGSSHTKTYIEKPIRYALGDLLSADGINECQLLYPRLLDFLLHTSFSEAWLTQRPGSGNE